MQEVPAPFFQEAFNLDQRQLWEELVQVGGWRGRRLGSGWARWRQLEHAMQQHAVGRPFTLRAACCLLPQVGSEQARQESLEQLSGWLDVVETHLVREIAARTGEAGAGSVGRWGGGLGGMHGAGWGLRMLLHFECCAARARHPHPPAPARTPSCPPDSFFDGSGYIQDVRGSALRLYQQVAGLRAQVRGAAGGSGRARWRLWSVGCCLCCFFWPSV